jgi:non-ribosomal peptide synthetase component F
VRAGGPSGVASLIQDARITVLNAVPSVLRALFADLPETTPGAATTPRHLRILRVGGESLFWSDIRLFRRAIPIACHILAAYSATEAIGTQCLVPRDAKHPAAGWYPPDMCRLGSPPPS